MFKDDFPIFKNNKNLIYLDSSATSQKPNQVIERINKYYLYENSNVHRGLYKLSDNATELYENSRRALADFLGAEYEEIVFTPGATHALNYASQMLSFKVKSKDGIIISSIAEHHANLLPWQNLAKNNKLELKLLNLDNNFKIDLVQLEKVLKSQKVSIVALSHASNVLGTITPIEQVVKLVRKYQNKAFIVVDGAQFVPHYKLNLNKLDIDFYAVAGHKMLGPTGTGLLYINKKISNSFDPVLVGGGIITKVSKTNANWVSAPFKFEAGTPNISGAIALAEAGKYLQKNYLSIQKHENNLIEYMLKELSKVTDLTIYGNKTILNRTSVFSFTIKNIHAHDVAQILADHNIAVRAGHHCCQVLHKEFLKVPSTVRASLYLYNTKEDIDKLVFYLTKAVNIFNGK